MSVLNKNGNKIRWETRLETLLGKHADYIESGSCPYPDIREEIEKNWDKSRAKFIGFLESIKGHV